MPWSVTKNRPNPKNNKRESVVDYLNYIYNECKE